jgi:hypothetical protein
MHNSEKFKFLDKDGNEKEFESVPYSFDLEDNVLVNRFGKDTLEEFVRTHILNFKITADHIKEDFPRLLVGDLSIINFRKQEGQYYDEMRKVYYFFLEFDSNAQLRLSKQLAETIASNLETLKTTLDGISKTISIPVSGKNIINS